MFFSPICPGECQMPLIGFLHVHMCITNTHTLSHLIFLVAFLCENDLRPDCFSRELCPQ